MPPKNSRKEYEEGGFYHIYNRGVEKRDIFIDDADYSVFISYLKLYLDTPPDQLHVMRDIHGRAVPPSRKNNNYLNEVELLAYCLMPNHYHLLLKQKTVRGMALLMQSLTTKYVMYFNKKYSRVGSLFQGRYKSVRMESENQFIGVSKYIHRNPLEARLTGPGPDSLTEYRYSSYRNYLGMFRQNWIKLDDILCYYPSPKTYKDFVEETGDLRSVYKLMIDLDY